MSGAYKKFGANDMSRSSASHVFVMWIILIGAFFRLGVWLGLLFILGGLLIKWCLLSDPGAKLMTTTQ
jgi:hypothetical protein